MACVEFDGVSKSYEGTPVLSGINFRVPSAGFLVIVGPSGCGKSTLLRLMSGLESPDSGRILIDDVDVCDTPPKDRGCAMVFQSYALYPHWTVFENLAFPLRVRRVVKDEIVRRVTAIAESLQLTAQLNKRPKALSGGERQRVALGRAMAADPLIYLFDEPLSNLDAPLRAGMRAEIVARQRALGKTALYVTHDQTEALTMGDRVLVLDAGTIMGDGTPVELYHNPPNRFVASFLGRPPINLIRGGVENHDGIPHLTPIQQRLPEPLLALLVRTGNRQVEIGIRPERITIGGRTSESPWRITGREFLGERNYYTVERNGHTIVGVGPADAGSPSVGDHVSVVFSLDHALVFHPETGMRII